MDGGSGPGTKTHFHADMLFDLTWWPWLVWVTADPVGLGGSWWSNGFTPTEYFQHLRRGWNIPAKTRALKSSRQRLSASPMTWSTRSALHQVYKQLNIQVWRCWCFGINDKYWILHIITDSCIAAKLNQKGFKTCILLSEGHTHSSIMMFRKRYGPLNNQGIWEASNFSTFINWLSKTWNEFKFKYSADCKLMNLLALTLKQKLIKGFEGS